MNEEELAAAAAAENGVKDKPKKKEKKDAKGAGKKADKKPSKLFKLGGGGKRGKIDSSVESADISSLQTSSPDQSNLTNETVTSDDNEGLNITFTQTPKFTRQYDYIEEAGQNDRKLKPIGGFTYEGKKIAESNDQDNAGSNNSPAKKITATAFNYAPGQAKKVAETAAEKRKALQEKNVDVNKPAETKTQPEKSGGLFSSTGSLRERLSLRSKDPKDGTNRKESADEASSAAKKTAVAGKDSSKKTDSKKADSKKDDAKKVPVKEGLLTSEQIREISKSLDKPEEGGSVLFKRTQKSEEESALNRTYTTTTHRTYPTEAGKSPESPNVIYSQVKKPTVAPPATPTAGKPIKETEFGVDPSVVVTTRTSTDTFSSSFANTSAVSGASSVFSEKDHERESIEATKDFISQERRNSATSEKSTPIGTTPMIVKTTTKQTMVKDREGVTQNIEEKVEDLLSGAVTVSTQVNKVSE